MEPLWISKVGHTVLARLLESQMWHQPTGSVGGRLSKGTMACACPDARLFSFSLYTTGILQAATRCWSSEGVSPSESVCGFPKRNCLELQQPPPPTQSPLVFAAKSCSLLTLFILHIPVKFIFSEAEVQSWNHNFMTARGPGGHLTHFPCSRGEETEAKEIKWLV